MTKKATFGSTPQEKAAPYAAFYSFLETIKHVLSRIGIASDLTSPQTPLSYCQNSKNCPLTLVFTYNVADNAADDIADNVADDTASDVADGIAAGNAADGIATSDIADDVADNAADDVSRLSQEPLLNTRHMQSPS